MFPPDRDGDEDASKHPDEVEAANAKKARGPVDPQSVVKRICGALGSAKPGPKLDLAVRLFTQFVDSALLQDVVETADGGSAQTIGDVVFEGLRGVVQPIAAKCARSDRLPALAAVFTSLRSKCGLDWDGFSPEQAKWLAL